MRKIIFLLIILMAMLINSKEVSAEIAVVTQSAQIKPATSENDIDLRVLKLKNYLNSHGSPLSEYSEEFIENADNYKLDYRLVAAISGVESSFGKRIPKGSYNAYGWSNGNFSFDSWEDSIEIVSKTLREKYYDKGATNITKIARRYAPPSKSWGWKVKFFMSEIERIPVEFDL